MEKIFNFSWTLINRESLAIKRLAAQVKNCSSVTSMSVSLNALGHYTITLILHNKYEMLSNVPKETFLTASAEDMSVFIKCALKQYLEDTRETWQDDIEDFRG